MTRALYVGLLVMAATILSMTSQALAAIRTESVFYRQGDAKLIGYLAYDDTLQGLRPGILIVHEWWGLNDYVKRRARQLAGLGYIVLAADIYGNGMIAKDRQEAGKLANLYRGGDRKLLRERVRAGLQRLREHSLTDKARIAAIGYCFGGTTVLELARSGVDLSGVVSFHGTLDTPNPADARPIKAKVLVLNGADDPSVPVAQITAFQEEMRAAKADWQMINYGGAVHSFTNPDSGSDPSKGAAYNVMADMRSWEHMRVFFAELFK